MSEYLIGFGVAAALLLAFVLSGLFRRLERRDARELDRQIRAVQSGERDGLF